MKRDDETCWPALRRLSLLLLLSVASLGCSTGVTGPDAATLSGTYQITGVRTLANGLGEDRTFKFTIVTVDAQRVILDFVAGDVSAVLPARDTASKLGDQYLVTWNGNAQFNHSLSFDAAVCTGNDIGGGGDVVVWATCSIKSVP